MSSQQFIFTMYKLSRVHPPDKRVLEDITLSFLPGAKIGVLGPNGSGKSTLLRIMAGLDKDFAGEAFAAEGTRVGFLPQEPVLDPRKNVQQHVEEAVAGKKALLTRFEELSMKMGEAALLPAVRAAKDATIVAAGTSCRQQVAHGAQRDARHPIVVLADSL